MTDINEVEQGDVVIIDPNNPGHLTLATIAYDPNVAGIISSKDQAGIIIGSRDDPEISTETPDNSKPLAIAGRALTKVTDENGPIYAGDLLTTSNTPGYAMRAEVDDFSKIGTVVGKAMEPHEYGEGMIMVLISLQSTTTPKGGGLNDCP